MDTALQKTGRHRYPSNRLWILRILPILISVFVCGAFPARAAIERVKFETPGGYLLVEVLDDDLIHFELSPALPGPAATLPIFTTPQVAKKDYNGPSTFHTSGPGGRVLETAEMLVQIDPATLCVMYTDKIRNVALTTICPWNLSQASKGLTITSGSMQHTYGLGEQFITAGTADGDWTGRVRSPGDGFGNQMTGFGGGAAGNLQIPVMYALGADHTHYALFLDHAYKQRWDFTISPWRVETAGDQIRGYVMTGSTLPDLRRDYMELTGHAPVPPKQMFGLWLSEYGYDGWNELESKLATLRTAGFPIDGFVLDLQWFGGITVDSDTSKMGRVDWDATNFPNAAAKLAHYRTTEGIGIIPIEESYISKGLPEHVDLNNRGFLVRAGCATCAPVYLTSNPWWGKGGMIDWTSDAAGDYWHDLKRRPLIEAGVAGHWIDLGEPEMYDSNDWTAGALPNKHGHADYHNLYNFMWAQSITRGYSRHNVTRRPFMMARSGAAGIQRTGASLWSADIGSNLGNLAAHHNAQMHMSLSGVDYFGSDIGGFHRGALGGDDLNETYMQWFANGMMFDVPGRPHTENLCNCKETAPDKIGHVASNLANLRQRYELIPYIYSLAHRAYRDAEPIVPPLVYYYQNDPNVRELGSEKLLGRDLLVATVTQPNATNRDVYLPKGEWINYHSHQWFDSNGQTFAAQPLIVSGVFRLPVYARAGAIVPKMFVDTKTMNAFGKRTDGTVRDELILRIYTSTTPSGFTLYEDDGETTAYLNNSGVRTTALTQQLAIAGEQVKETVVIAAATGNYTGSPASRGTFVELVAKDRKASSVTLNGTSLPQRTTREALEAATQGWFNAGANLVLAKAPKQNVTTAKTFVFTLIPDAVQKVQATFECKNGGTTWGQSVYVVGNTAELGNWNAAQAIKLNPNGPYPTWTGLVQNLPASSTLEWKCIKRPETGEVTRVDLWEPGANNVLVTPASGHAGATTGDFSGSDAGTQSGTTVTVNFVCDNGVTTPGQSVYVSGSAAALGNWSPDKALKLDPTNYPRWTGSHVVPSGSAIDWKCVKRPENAATPVVWEPGENNRFTANTAGGVTTFGVF